MRVHKWKNKLVDFCLFTNLWPIFAPRCSDFWNKWSWGLCLIPMLWITYSVNKLTHKTYLVNVFGYNVTIIKKNLNFSILLAYQFMHTDAPTFDINGRDASLWYQYGELHREWTKWPIWRIRDLSMGDQRWQKNRQTFQKENSHMLIIELD